MTLYSSTREDITAWGSRAAHVARRATRDDNMPPKEGGGHGLIGSKTKARSKARALLASLSVAPGEVFFTQAQGFATFTDGRAPYYTQLWRA